METLLKKEFKERDVQRLRNIMSKKYGNKDTISIGYQKAKEYHEEGDTWLEGEKTWTIKNGLKQSVSKLDLAKKLCKLPLLCPECKHLMKSRIDSPFYLVHKKCLNCVSIMETKLKQEGKWEDYEKQIHNQGIDDLINEFKLWVEDENKETNKSYITEDGDLEKWEGGLTNEQKEQNINETIKYLENLKK